ncbi:hypothetical protein [Parafilimonas sp.]|uniref:hypothetical protein n=1 Tax=Parafilimonas sp. TaxID=1969739 RepID=UPI0039E5D5E4
MKKHLTVFVCLGFYLHAISQSDVATAKMMHITVDGNSKEWGPLNFYDEKTQLNFAIANDDDNIYFCFATATQAAQTKLMQAGMKITLSRKGRGKKGASVLYPLPQSKQQPPAHDSGFDKNNPPAPGAQNAPDGETFWDNYIAHHTTMKASGFANANGEIPTSGTGIRAAVNWDSSLNMIYEIAIAKKELFGTGYTAKDLSGNITLSVELNGLSRAATGDAKSGGAPPAGDMHGGMEGGGMRGGGMPGGGFNGGGRPPGNQHANSSNSTSLNKKTSFKQKFVLNDGSKG